LVTNIPAPYRIPVFNRVAQELGEDFLVIFCARLEPNRQWDLAPFEFNHTYLKESHFISHGMFVHCNPDVIGVLRRFRPDVVITSGFNPTHLLAWAYTLLSGAKHVPMTDGWIASERELGLAHRVVRRIVFRGSRAFIGASKHSRDLYRSYGCADTKLYQSHLCIDNDKFIQYSTNRSRPYDFMFSGQIVEGKMPEFFVEVVRRVKEKRGEASVLVIGDGKLRDSFLDSLKEIGAKVTYAGFIAQGDLPSYYSQAKLLLFTTRNDAWGIVANEALASGTLVITTPYAGAAHDLVIDGENGYVVDTDASLWATKIIELLQNEPLLEQMRLNAVSSVAEFNFDNAARGIIEAAKRADGPASH
jgi:glycosyltransferase involved in cell wall biosynthesis